MYKYTFYNKFRSAKMNTEHPIPLTVGQEVSLDFTDEKLSGIYEVKKIRPGFSPWDGVDFYVEVE